MINGQTQHALKKFRTIRSLCDANDDLKIAIKEARVHARELTKPISVDITSRCNLFCEGCYYYAGDLQAMVDETDEQKWRDYFRAEGELGTKYVYIGGAEAALHPERIRAAADYIPNGIIAANGTIKIAPDIPYRIAISVWGNADSTEELRGGGTFWKALRNYADDSRAMFVYTVNSKNIDQIEEVAEVLQLHGAKMTFNMYSPTDQYLDQVSKNAPNDAAFFRISSEEDHLGFTSEDLEKCRNVIDELASKFPNTIVYPKAFNHEVTKEGSLFDLDPETGIATNCAGVHNGTHKTILSTLKESTAKCCVPNIDCSSCRLLATVLPSRLMPKVSDIQTKDSVRDWLNINRYWAWFYLNKTYQEIVS
jgi:sulfatase maturation enzyme AslB (radical SAM superfamily)